MHSSPRRIKFITLIILAIVCVVSVIIRYASAAIEPDIQKLKTPPQLPSTHFSPSNAKTADGNLIPSSQFYSAARCVSCHKETHEDWSESLHRNSVRAPFYKESVDILERQRGIEFTRHCESCHAPVSLVSGALTTGSNESRKMDDEGITCTVCHSITEARLDGTGSYTIGRPSLIVKADGTPVYGDVSDDEILNDVSGHKRAMMRPLLKQPEFCATCHKSSVPPSLNNYKFLKGFSAYDEWQMSGASTETITPYYRRDKRADCASCHMSKTEALKDMAATDGYISSHRFLGANTATPLFYGQHKQVEKTIEFLKAGVISADIFALRNEATGKAYISLEQKNNNAIELQPGEEWTAEVVVFNRKAAHSFPPELRDMYEPWVEFEAKDSSGKTIFHSGFIKPDKTLDESAHVYKQILLDSFSRPITRHQVWLSAIKGYDNFIPPGRSDLVRYSFVIPANEKGKFTGLTLYARVNYRRFIQEYTEYVLRRNNITKFDPPVVQMAEAMVKIVPTIQNKKRAEETKTNNLPEKQAQRWNDYGIALLEQFQFSQACDAFKRASELNPRDPDPLISAAVAELKTERYAPEREQVKKAAVFINAALKINPTLPRALFYKAIILRADGKIEEAVNILSDLAKKYPRDREVQRQWGQTLYTLGRISEAKQAFEAIIAIDPTDADAYQFLAPIYTSLGRQKDADQAHSLYLQWRNDPLAENIATRFFTLNPQWAEVRIPYHIYSVRTPSRPILSGERAAPVE